MAERTVFLAAAAVFRLLADVASEFLLLHGNNSLVASTRADFGRKTILYPRDNSELPTMFLSAGNGIYFSSIGESTPRFSGQARELPEELLIMPGRYLDPARGLC
jgi:hypothetical protein